MFGLNDNNQQTNDPTAATAAASAMPANPFGDPAPAATSEPAVTSTPVAPDPLPTLPPQPAEVPTVSKHTDPLAAKSDDLMDLKEQALHSLQPLVGHLDQTPEEKFKTTMMLIQATDNSSLVKEAYEAANQITDEKARAQALLDVVNEINYFTQHHDDQAPETKA